MKQIMQVFTDCSYVPGSNVFGTSMFMIRADETELSHSQQIRFKDIGFKEPLRSLVFMVGYAILNCLQLLKKYKNVSIQIFTDSDGFFAAYHNADDSPHEHIKSIVNQVKKLIVKLCLDVEIMCIKGHANVYGNTQADRLAKRQRVDKKWKFTHAQISEKAAEIYQRNLNPNHEQNWFDAIEELKRITI
jgi:hypothetical protein